MLVSRQDMRGYTPRLATGQRVRDTHVNLRPNSELHRPTTSPILPLSALLPNSCYGIGDCRSLLRMASLTLADLSPVVHLKA
jgi:hypothetical protein